MEIVLIAALALIVGAILLAAAFRSPARSPRASVTPAIKTFSYVITDPQPVDVLL